MKKENRLVVASVGWAESAPEWLKKEIEMERLMYGMSAIKNGGQHEVGDAEACLYLYTEGLVQSQSYEMTQIYLYLATKLMRRRKCEVPKDIAIEKLSEYEEGLLKDLKYRLYTSRGGDIHCQLFDILKQLKKSCEKSYKSKGGEQNGTKISTIRTEQPASNRGRFVSNGKSCEGSICD